MVRAAVVTALALFLTGAALADDWKEDENRDHSFTIHFPAAPTVEAATSQAADGRSFPARVFSAKQETGTFKVTVVEMPGEETGPDAAVMKEATKVVSERGTIKFDIPHRVRAVWRLPQPISIIRRLVARTKSNGPTSATLSSTRHSGTPLT
jgi:hypothetical protein